MKTRWNAVAVGVLTWMTAGCLFVAYGQATIMVRENTAPAAPASGVSTNAPAAPAGSEAAPSAAAPAVSAAASEGEPVIAPPEKMVIEASGKKDLINVAVDNETLENVVTMFTRITGANIVATSTNLSGTVTVNLKDVEWKAALSSILDLHGLALIEKMPGSGVYSVMPKPPLDSQPLVIETFFLKHTAADELIPVIRSMLLTSTNAPSSTINELASRNALIVKTTEPNMREVKRMIESMDIPSKQVCVEAKFLELDENASKQLGIRWDSLGEFGMKLQAGPMTYDKTTGRTLTTSDSSTRNQKATDQDTVQKQFRMNGSQFEDIKDTKYLEAPPGSGEYISESTITPTRQQKSGKDNSDQLLSTDLNGFTRNITESQAAILEMDSFNVILSALKQTEGVQVVSNPKIIVTSGSTNASFNVGQREPIVKTTVTRGNSTAGQGDLYASELDTAISTDFIKGGYLETGISLKVIPVVKTDDMIEAQIWPRLSRTDQSKVKLSADGVNTWPFIEVKEIKSQFTLRSGQTVAIGGLTSTGDSKRVTKVPLLGDIPLIGKYLFSHTADVKSQTETIIFVTLSRAEPADLKENTGIPLDSELVHKRMIQRKMRQEEFNAELKALEKAADIDRAKKAQSELKARK